MHKIFWTSATAFALSLLTVAPARAGQADGRLDVYFIDAEGGAATLLVTPAGESLLVDTGNPGTRDANRIAAAARSADLKKIDFLVITHFHGDHFGGAPELAKLLSIGVLYDNADQNENRQNEKPSQAYLDMKVDRRVMINPGDILPLKQREDGAKLTIQCLAARK